MMNKKVIPTIMKILSIDMLHDQQLNRIKEKMVI